MSNKTLDILAVQDKESTKNSYYRSPKKSPHIEKVSPSVIEVKTVDNIVQISKLEEIILYIIAMFKFSPFWLIQQWFFTFKRKDGFETVSNWINVGLVWAEASSMGVFIRPTRFLLDMYKIEDDKYIEIPFGLLNHNCAEQQLLFDLSMGNNRSEMWLVIQDEETLPVYHPLGLEIENEQGTVSIRETDFRIGYKRYDTKEILTREEDLIRQVKSGMKYTDEFNDFSKFPIVTINKETGEILTQTPDIIVPIPRDNGKAKSYAIELELTPKSLNKYIGIMKNYKDNIKFGRLFYLCGSQKIAKLIKDAYRSVGGLGDCDLFLLPFKAPAQRLENFTYKDEIEQENLLKETVRNTNNEQNN